MTAKEYLSQYRLLCAEIDTLCDELKQLEALAVKTSPSKDSFSGSRKISDRVGYTTAKIIDLKNKINAEVGKLIELRRQIVLDIKTVPNLRQQIVLRLRYINGWDWEKIAQKLNCTDRTVRNIFYNAIENFSLTFHEKYDIM